MKLFHLAVICLMIVQFNFHAQGAGQIRSAETTPSVERGRYIARITGCNDCHTPMYGPKNGAVPENEWLIGVNVGWKGGWGTTYATNLRQRVANMTEDQWVAYLKNLRTLPPMPYFAVNDFNEVDSRSLYRFIRSLGNHPQQVQAALPPGKKPTTPYVNFDLVMP